jgi:hypothetical protein
VARGSVAVTGEFWRLGRGRAENQPFTALLRLQRPAPLPKTGVSGQKLFSEMSLRRFVEEYVAHFHQERPHQGLENKPIQPEFANPNRAGAIQCRKRLGGLLKYYYRDAA